ncbi:FAD/FMN-containing dehydrogenase [Pseudomonas schmalbachii]|uniref:FAD/FMN-containing dehydrogenase n=1 Tax=Pseudomonas schmalbachii TaxID=2816993 RepID=A0ABS3TST9_9PSED|nr:FAD/FMN-containing dehydrogenase [Pseudomonas schmalbachii]MBO3276742.1 FAD/FMN-containing dehydrogenase [Pseudomonas schmalbachii]
MRKFCGLVLLWLVSLAAGAQGPESPAGWTLLDQFDKPYTLDDRLRVLLIARDMTGANLVKEALAERPQGYLEARHAAFVADISSMPAVISKLFAVPAMRDYAYRVLLDRGPRVANRYPQAPEKVLWLQLEGGSVVSSQTFDSAQKLREALEQAPR